MTTNSRGLAILLSALMVASMAAAPAAAETTTDGVTTSADAADQIYIQTNVTKSVHQMGWAATEYEDDSGAIASLPAVVNDSYDNPYEFVATDIEFDDADKFPRKDDEAGNNSASALDASEWTADNAGTAQTGAINDVTTAPGVSAVEITVDGQSSSDTFEAVYSNFSVTSDAEKRYLQFFLDIDTLDSGATVDIQAVDSDGDYVNATIDSSLSASTDNNVVANSTGEGYVFQQQVGSLSVYGSGDGSMGEIQKLIVEIDGADANLDFSVVNAEKLSAYDLGSKLEDTDDDDELETVDHVQITSPGAVEVETLDSLGSTYSDATLHSVTIPMQFRAADLDDGADDDIDRRNATFEAASNFPSYEWQGERNVRLRLIDAYDLSYTDSELVMEQALPDSRYQTVEVVEGAGTNEYSELSSWSDLTSSLNGVDEKTSLDSTVSAGTEYAISIDALYTSEEKSGLLTNVGGGPMAEDQGFFDSITNTVMTVIGGVLVFLGLKSRSSG